MNIEIIEIDDFGRNIINKVKDSIESNELYYIYYSYYQNNKTVIPKDKTDLCFIIGETLPENKIQLSLQNKINTNFFCFLKYLPKEHLNNYLYILLENHPEYYFSDLIISLINIGTKPGLIGVDMLDFIYCSKYGKYGYISIIEYDGNLPSGDQRANQIANNLIHSFNHNINDFNSMVILFEYDDAVTVYEIQNSISLICNGKTEIIYGCHNTNKTIKLIGLGIRD